MGLHVIEFGSPSRKPPDDPLDQRRPVYAGLAAHTVSTDQREPAEIAAEIAALLKATEEPGA